MKLVKQGERIESVHHSQAIIVLLELLLKKGQSGGNWDEIIVPQLGNTVPGKLLLLLQSKMSASLQYREIIQANLLQMAAPTSALGKDLMTRFELDSLARLICSDRSASIEANIVRVISPIANLIQFQTVLYTLLGMQTLWPLQQYNLSTNQQYRHDQRTQAEFLFLVGRIKSIRRPSESVEAYKSSREICERLPKDGLLRKVLRDMAPQQSKAAYVTNWKLLLRYLLKKETELLQKACKQLSVSEQLSPEQLLQNEWNEWQQQRGKIKNYLQQVLKVRTGSMLQGQQGYRTLQKKESKLALLLHGLYHENNPLVVRKMRESRLVKWVVEWKGISDKGEDYRNGVAASRSNAVQSQINIDLGKMSQISQIGLEQRSGIKTSTKKAMEQSSISQQQSKHSKQTQSAPTKQPLKQSQMAPKQKSQLTAKQHSKLYKQQIEQNSLSLQCWKQCQKGDIVMKCNAANDICSNRFLQANELGIRWAASQEQIQNGTSYQWKEIKGIVHGIVTRNMLEKVQEVDLLPWRVFSLICHKRSLDFVVLRDADVYHWLIGISYKLNLDWGQQQPQTIHWKHKDVQHKKLQEIYCVSKSVRFTRGKILWKVFLMRVRRRQELPKQKRRTLFMTAYYVRNWDRLLKQKQEKQSDVTSSKKPRKQSNA